MAAANPPTPDTTKQAPALIPVKWIKFLPAMNLDVPGLPMGCNGATASEPRLGDYTRIGFDPRSQRFRVMFFKAGADERRPPTRVVEYPAAICIAEMAL